MYEEDKLPAKDTLLTFNVHSKPKSVKILGSSKQLGFDYQNNIVSIKLPLAVRTNLVDVVQIEL